MTIIQYNRCNGCGNVIEHGDTVSALLKVDVTGSGMVPGDIRLKLSDKAVHSRAIKIFCSKCLEPEHFG